MAPLGTCLALLCGEKHEKKLGRAAVVRRAPPLY